MKLVIAYIRPYKLEEVKDALKAAGVTGMSVAEIRGFGRQSGHTEVYRGAEYEVDFVPKTRIDVLTADEDVAAIVTALSESARTGEIGDGKILVLPVEDVLRIRTGERGHDAI